MTYSVVHSFNSENEIRKRRHSQTRPVCLLFLSSGLNDNSVFINFLVQFIT